MSYLDSELVHCYSLTHSLSIWLWTDVLQCRWFLLLLILIVVCGRYFVIIAYLNS